MGACDWNGHVKESMSEGAMRVAKIFFAQSTNFLESN